MAAKAKKTITGLQEAYLDYVNNYISVLKFAADYGMTEAMAKATIEKGAVAHEAFVAWYKEVRALRWFRLLFWRWSIRRRSRNVSLTVPLFRGVRWR